MAITTFNLISTIIIYQRSDERITKIENIVKDQNSFKVTATMYNAEVKQCDKDPLTTAGMYKINPHKASEHNWIAVSRDLLKRVPYWKSEPGQDIFLTKPEKKGLKSAALNSTVFKLIS